MLVKCESYYVQTSIIVTMYLSSLVMVDDVFQLNCLFQEKTLRLLADVAMGPSRFLILVFSFLARISLVESVLP